MLKWYKFLTEADMENTLTFEQLESIFRVFHLSDVALGDSKDSGEFEFTPRTPRSPLPGEDNFTKRISLAPNIRRAIFALTTLKNKHSHMTRSYYVYAGDLKTTHADDIPTIKLPVEMRRCKRDLSFQNTHNQKQVKATYGHKFGWVFSDFLQNAIKKKIAKITDNGKIKPSMEDIESINRLRRAGDPKEILQTGHSDIANLFYACVPDAYQSREEWSLEPTNLYYIGRIIPGEHKVSVPDNIVGKLKEILSSSTKKVVFKQQEIYEQQDAGLNIKYKTNALSHFIETHKGIKQLRVPSWYLQSLYSSKDDVNAMAVVAFDKWKPIGIATLSLTYDTVANDFNEESVALINLYVDPDYRGKNISTNMFKKIEKLATSYKYIEAGRRTAEMMRKRGYKSIEQEPYEIADGTIFVNKNYKAI